MKRRQFITLATAAIAPAVIASRAEAAARPRSLEQIRNNWQTLLPAGAELDLSTEPVKKTKDEWEKLLSHAQFRVLREEDTERPGSSPLNAEKRPGVFVCAGCQLPLFTSEMKYESGTGWPSFFTTIPGHLDTKTDFKLIIPRKEYHCIRCGGHQGHIFSDGPAPTGERWCNNGVALVFIPA